MTSMWNVLWAAPAAVGFAMMFRVRPKALPIVAIVAIVARFISEFLLNQGLNVVLADYVAAIVVGVIAFTISPMLDEASPVFAFAPVIPLIPGVILTDALDALIKWIRAGAGAGTESITEFAAFANSGFTGAAIILVLCLGTLSPMLVLPKRRSQ